MNTVIRCPDSPHNSDSDPSSTDEFVLDYAFAWSWWSDRIPSARVRLVRKGQNLSSLSVQLSDRRGLLVEDICLTGDVIINLDHRSLRIGLPNRLVFLRFQSLEPACEFTALLLGLTRVVIEEGRCLVAEDSTDLHASTSTIMCESSSHLVESSLLKTVSTAKLFQWADYVPSGPKHRKRCEYGDSLLAAWIAASAVWAMWRLSRMIPENVWRFTFAWLQHFLYLVLRSVLERLGLWGNVTETVLDVINLMILRFLQTLNYLVPVQIFAAGRSVVEPLMRLWQTVSESAVGIAVAGLLHACWRLASGIWAITYPARVVLSLLFTFVRLVSAFVFSLFGGFGKLPWSGVFEAGRKLGTVGVASKDLAQGGVFMLLDSIGATWRNMKAAFYETFRLGYNAIERFQDRQHDISHDGDPIGSKVPTPPSRTARPRSNSLKTKRSHVLPDIALSGALRRSLSASAGHAPRSPQQLFMTPAQSSRAESPELPPTLPDVKSNNAPAGDAGSSRPLSRRGGRLGPMENSVLD